MSEKKKNVSVCSSEFECVKGTNICCRDCELRSMCDDVCDGDEMNGLDGPCEHRIED